MGTTSHRNVSATSSSTVDYLPTLTALRGLAALWVMLFHLDVITFYRGLGILVPHTATGLITKGYLWVDFFFVLSGFIIQHTYGPSFEPKFTWAKFWRYLNARFWRIYPLHLFTLALLLCFALTLPSLIVGIVDPSWETFFSWKALISNVLLTNAMNQHTYLSWNIVSWSIGAEWWTYIVGVAAIVYLRRAGIGLSIISMVTGVVLLTLLISLHSGDSLDITYDYGFLRCLLGFIIGTAAHTLFRENLMREILSKDFTFLVLILALAAVMHWQAKDIYAVPLFALLVLAGAFNAGRVARVMSARLPQYLGRISYSIYLLHGVWFMVFWFLLPRFTDAWAIQTLSPTQHIIYMTMFVSCTLISSAISYRYVELSFRKGLKKNNQTLAFKANTTPP